MKRPKHFDNITEVADFVEMDKEWRPPHVIEWSNLWATKQKLQLIASVGHLKSNWISLEIVKVLLNDPNYQIGYFTESDGLSKAMCRKVKDMLRSDGVKDEFGDVRGKTWSDTELYLKGRSEYIKNANLLCAAPRSAIEGYRPRWVILDDPVGLKESISAAERNFREKWVGQQLWPRIDWQEGGRVLVTGSYWGRFDFYHHMAKEYKLETVVFPAHDENYQHLLWPQKYTPKLFKGLRKTMPEKIYILRWLCDIKGAEGNNFKPEWFQIIDDKDIPYDRLIITQGWDLAITEKELIGTSINPKTDPDYTAGIVIGIYHNSENENDPMNGNIYILDLYVDRIIMGHEDIIERYYQLWPQTSEIGIETNQFQKLVFHQTKAKASAIPVTKVDHYSPDKITRILGLEPYYKQLRVFTRADLPHRNELYGEYLAFPEASEKRDVLDALEIAIKLHASNRVADLGDYLEGLF